MEDMMMRYLRVLFSFLFLSIAANAFAAEPVARFFLGANGSWYSGDSAEGGYPSDFELGGSAVASLSPHISLVGGAWYGTSHSYLRGTAGARVTVSDVDNPNFSIGVGGFYQASSDVSDRPQEWNFDASIGWRPYPSTMPRGIVVAQGFYGLDSEQAGMMLGVRYSLGYAEERNAP